jgi:flagellar biosynthesis protein FlhF
MIIRSYTGRSVPEALEKVKHDLGDAALIIETRTVREPGLMGRKNGYEVVAALDDQPTVAPTTRSPEHETRSAGQASRLVRNIASVTGAAGGDHDGIEDELAAIRRQLARLAVGQGTPIGHLGDSLATLFEEAELPADLIAELDAAVAAAGPRLAADKRRDFCALLLARQLSCSAPIDWTAVRRLMVVGPTGVGKTTTIAKLAGELVLKRRKRVALVTIDTYRVGAQDQLRAYADLLDVPCEVATTPVQFAASLKRFADRDAVLIDTAGRSPADSARVHELKSFCRAAMDAGFPASVMLAVAANGGRAEFAAVVERFSILPIEHTVVTKLDECVAAGRLYGCLRRHRLPLNYLTTGQEVPDDIVPANAGTVIERIFARQVVEAA